MTLDPRPRILGGKLNAGFPHIAIEVPSSAVARTEFSLSRFNVAMTRVLRRDGLPGRPESPTNGRYYGDREIPIARTDADKIALLGKHLSKGTMIEVLIHGDLLLPDDTSIICFCEEDLQIAQRVLAELAVPWAATRQQPIGPYKRRADYAAAVEDFIAQSLADPGWRGNGLEFDRV